MRGKKDWLGNPIAERALIKVIMELWLVGGIGVAAFTHRRSAIESRSSASEVRGNWRKSNAVG